MKRHDVSDYQEYQRQRKRGDVQREKAVQGRIGDHIIAADPFHQAAADDGDAAEQGDDDLGAPVTHVAPRQHVTHEGFGHQYEENQTAENPQQFTRLAMRSVHQRSEHMQVHVAHDVFDRAERFRGRGLVAHRQENTGHQLIHQNQQRERAEVVPEIEILRRVVLGHVFSPQGQQRKALVDPVD